MLYRTVKTDIWSDPWFQELQPSAKCLFLYLFTNDRVSACGAMEVSLSRIAFDTKIPAKKIAAELAAFGDKILWLADHNLIVVRNFYRHQRSQSSENFTKAAKKAMADLPGEATAWLGGVYPELLDTLPQPIPMPSPTLGDKETATATATAVATAKEVAVLPPTPKRTVKEPIPADLVERIPPDTWSAIRSEQKLTDDQLRFETAQMVDHFQSKGERRPDWVAGWRKWMRSDYRQSKPHVDVGESMADWLKNGAVAPELRR